MQHWIIDRDAIPLPSWLAAMPEATILQREQISAIPGGEPGIIWYRLRAGEAAAVVLPSMPPGPGQFVVVLADEPDESVIADALASGAAGCCNTHAAPEVLRQVALVVENGGLWVGQSLLRRLVGSTSHLLGQRSPQQKNEGWSTQLSEREAQVARLVAGGASNREIAGQLSITERTVKAHLTAVFEKLGLRDRLQLSLRINGLNI
jgi:DNA-binding NarL/FixJ family response regulator